jgi:enolase-phosphatase E1
MSPFRAVLLDVEGTTTPLQFVTGPLFPFARERFPDFLREHAAAADVAIDLAALHEEHGQEPAAPAWRENEPVDSALRYALWLMDCDRKSTALKSLQGRIWQEGFTAGTLRGAVYPDVPVALERWHGQGREACIFSSGSVLAQKLLFGHSTAGDLCPWLAAFFDTTTGPKREPESYRRIAAARSRPAAEWLFLSDVAEELHAARKAGMATALVARPGTLEPVGSAHEVIHNLSGL